MHAFSSGARLGKQISPPADVGCEPMALARVLVLGAALALLPDCTNVTRLSAGPAVAFPGDGHRSYGEEIVLRRGVGTSDFESIGVAEYEARLLVSQETHALSLGAGYGAMKWWGDGIAFANLGPAFGFELTRGKPLGNAGLHGALGFGWTFEESRSQRPARWLAFGMDRESYVTVERKRRAVTLELMGSADLRGTRQPLYTVGVLLGVAFTNEQDDVQLPPRRPLDGFGLGNVELFRRDPPTRR
jgi:hypothetical protein